MWCYDWMKMLSLSDWKDLSRILATVCGMSRRGYSENRWWGECMIVRRAVWTISAMMLAKIAQKWDHRSLVCRIKCLARMYSEKAFQSRLYVQAGSFFSLRLYYKSRMPNINVILTRTKQIQKALVYIGPTFTLREKELSFVAISHLISRLAVLTGLQRFWMV